jgi:hypothetical protein
MATFDQDHSGACVTKVSPKCHQSVTKVSPKCHQSVTKVSPKSPKVDGRYEPSISPRVTADALMATFDQDHSGLCVTKSRWTI